MHRLFIALRPPLAIRTGLRAVMHGVAGARWQDDAQLHLTLRYIGDLPARAAEEVALALTTIRAPAPEVALAGVGWFAGERAGPALWAGVAPHDALAALHRKLDRALVALGLPAEGRAYLPHITLARCARSVPVPEAFLATHAGLSSPPFRMDALIPYESLRGQGGAHYQPRARVALG